MHIGGFAAQEMFDLRAVRHAGVCARDAGAVRTRLRVCRRLSRIGAARVSSRYAANEVISLQQSVVMFRG